MDDSDFSNRLDAFLNAPAPNVTKSGRPSLPKLPRAGSGFHGSMLRPPQPEPSAMARSLRFGADSRRKEGSSDDSDSEAGKAAAALAEGLDPSDAELLERMLSAAKEAPRRIPSVVSRDGPPPSPLDHRRALPPVSARTSGSDWSDIRTEARSRPMEGLLGRSMPKEAVDNDFEDEEDDGEEEEEEEVLGRPPPWLAEAAARGPQGGIGRSGSMRRSESAPLKGLKKAASAYRTGAARRGGRRPPAGRRRRGGGGRNSSQRLSKVRDPEVGIPGTLTIDEDEYTYIPERRHPIDMSLYSRSSSGLSKEEFQDLVDRFATGREVHRLRSSLQESKRVMQQAETFIARTQAEFVGQQVQEIASKSKPFSSSTPSLPIPPPPTRQQDPHVARAQLSPMDLAFVDPSRLFDSRRLAPIQRPQSEVMNQQRQALDSLRTRIGSVRSALE